MRSSFACPDRLVRVALLGALLAAGAPPARATLAANPSSPTCERQEVDDALRKIRGAGPEIAAALDVIAASRLRCVITPIADGRQHRDDTAQGSEIFWMPDGKGQRYHYGLCIDPVAALAHELWHCYARAVGSGDRDRRTPVATHKAADPGRAATLPKSELEAVNFENGYRTANHLCRRTTYDDVAVPGASPTCPPPDRSARCPRPPTICSPLRCCCWIYGGVKDPKSGGWGACVIDQLTPQECAAYTRPNQSSAGCYQSPCSFADTPACP